MKYVVRATELDFLPGIEIEAESEEEARAIYRRKWENGELESEDCDLEISVEKQD